MARRSSILAVIALLFHSGAWAASANEIRSLLEQNKPQDAYQLGRASPHMLGDPAFDFFYGIAAIDAGHAGEGVLALERYILSYPDNSDARFQLARGYFILGEDQRARDEFETLLPNSAGEQKVAVERYLDAIRTRESRYQPTAKAYMEAGLGVDTNINAGLGSGATPLIPGLGTLPAISPNSVSARERDTFLTASAGVQGNYPVSPGVSLYAAGGIDARRHLGNNNDVFDQHSLGGAGGVSYLREKNLFKAGAFISQSWVDNQSYVLSYGLNGEWNYQFDQSNRLALGAQMVRFEYDDMYVYLNKDKTGGLVLSTATHRNSDFVGVSGSWTHAIATPFQPVITLSVNYGEDRNQRNRDDLSRDIYGARASFAMTPAERWGVSAGIGYQENRHHAVFTTGSENRHDTSWSLDGSLSYFYTKQFSVRTEVQILDQISNVGLFRYNREVVSVKARYEF
ncbi:MAG: surface lipoprotein assembly modifier [Gallionella sp.]|nr:surface lipoprotein assembly modifier [Gallionella sp.]